MHTQITIAHDYSKVRDYLTTHKLVDMITGGGSPATFRWLSKANKYINVGLEEKEKDKSCVVRDNDNSYLVLPSDIENIAKDIETHFGPKA